MFGSVQIPITSLLKHDNFDWLPRNEVLAIQPPFPLISRFLFRAGWLQFYGLETPQVFLEDDEVAGGPVGHCDPLLGSSGIVASSGKAAAASPLCHQHGRQYQHQHSTDTSTRSSITPDLWTWTHGSRTVTSMSALISTVFKCNPTHTLEQSHNLHVNDILKERRKQEMENITFSKMDFSWETWELQTMWPHSMSF